MAVIVLEGPDGGGKSTLGKALGDAFDVPFLHDGGPSSDAALCRIRINQFLGYKNTIRDRSTLFSDAIYKKAFGKEPFVPEAEIEETVAYLGRRGDAMLIYVRPPMDVLVRNTEFLARAKPHKPPEYANQLKSLIPIVADLYDRAARRWAALGLRVLRYDYTSTKLNEFVEDVRLFWDRF